MTIDIRPRNAPRAFAARTPSICRTRLRFVSNSAKTPSNVVERLSAALLGWMGCPVAMDVDALLAQLVHDVLQMPACYAPCDL